MPRQNSIIASWTKGEVSPLAHGRVDVNLYTLGAKTIENLIVRPQGPVFRRSGTKFVRSSKLVSQPVRIIPFTVSDEVAYELEFGAQAGTAITAVADNGSGNFRITSTAHKKVNGDQVTIYGSENYPTMNGTWTIGNVAANTFDIAAFFAGSGAADGKWTHYPAGYIHFYKNKEPLFETTTTELEAFTVGDSGLDDLMAIAADTAPDDLPGWGDVQVFGAAQNGDISLSSGAGNVVRVTTTVPHTLRTGVSVFMYSNTDPNTISGNVYTVTRVSAHAVDLQGTTFVSDAAAPDLIAMFALGLLPGDRFFFSGGAEYPELTEQFHTAKTVTSYLSVTVANVAFVNHGTPTQEELHTIPIEVLTPFTEDELTEIKYVQSADVLYLFHPNHKPQKLVRLDDDGDRNDWLLADVEFTDGPYLPLNDLSPNIDTTTPANGAKYSDVYFEVSAYTHTATVTAAVAFAAAAGDQNRYLEYRQGDQWQLAQLTSASSSSTTGTISIVDNILLRLDETTRLTNKGKVVPGSAVNSSSFSTLALDNRYRVYHQRVDPNDALASNLTTTVAPTTASALAPGTIKSQFSNTFSQADVGKYVRIPSDAAAPTASTGPVPYWVQILKVDSGTAAGTSAKHSPSVQMVSNFSTGNFVISAETRTGTVIAYRNGTTFAAFAVSDVGRLMRLGFGGRWTWCKITSHVSTSQVTVQFYEDMPRDPHNAANVAGALNPSLTYSGGFVTGAAQGRTYDWRMGAWSKTTGYPAVGTFHEERLWFGNTVTQPQTLWGSVSGDFENMLPTELDSTVLDDNAVTVTLGSTRANAIKWMISGPAMTIGTNGGEWQMRANTSINEAITPSNVKVVEYTGHGSKAETIPARVGSSILFVDRSGEKVQEAFYSYEKDALDTDDLTVISEHILREHGGAVATAYQQKPHSIFWVACGDGTLAAMTFNKKQEVVAWHHHTIAGDGLVEDISVIPSADDSQDELWMVVKRTINGGTRYYIEVLEEDFYPSSSSSRLGMRFLDGHKLIEDFTGTAISGLHYLEGQTVVAVVDGTRATGTFTVASGAITLSAGATSELLIGLLGNADLVSLPPEGGSQFGTSQGQMKRLVYMDTRFYNTSQLKFGPSFSSMISKTLPVTSPTVWFTGTDRIVPAHGYNVESSWFIRQSEPYPLNILFVVAKLETNE